MDSLPRPLSANDQMRANLRELLDMRNMTQSDLAVELGVSQPWVSKRMSGVTPFALDDLDRIGAAFGLTPCELLEHGFGKWDRRRSPDRRSYQDRRRSRNRPSP
jgi:transcriptional regulator with XRE-family HTH domain